MTSRGSSELGPCHITVPNNFFDLNNSSHSVHGFSPTLSTTPKSWSRRSNSFKVSPVGPRLSSEYIYWLLHEQFANADSLDLDNVFDKASNREFNVPQSRDIGECAVKWVVSFPPKKFSSWCNEPQNSQICWALPGIAGCSKHTNSLRWISWKLDGGESTCCLPQFQEVFIPFSASK